MSAIGALACVFVVSFLLGSIPWGVIISRVFYHTDVRQHGSGNIGTTNAIRTMGKKGGYAVFLLDFGKGLVSGLIAWLAFGAVAQGPDAGTLTASYDTIVTCAFLACILGHIFSPWLHFKGGKGIAVAIGCMFVAFGPVIALFELAIFAIVVISTRYVSAGSLAAAIACPFFSLWAFWGNPPAIIMASAAAVVVIWAHRANIGRLRAGTESRVGSKKKEGEGKR